MIADAHDEIVRREAAMVLGMVRGLLPILLESASADELQNVRDNMAAADRELSSAIRRALAGATK